MSRLYISAAHKSSGKTTVSLGLCAALRSRGIIVQPFKKGPDYIDPMWLGRAAGRACYNLDFYTMSRDEILARTVEHSTGAELSLIEGNKGLYDGLDLDGSNSNAALARLLDTPVILVLDARGMTRGIAPLILGYQAFDTDIQIAGVILNQLGGSRHEAKLRAVIEHYTDISVIGAVARDKRLAITERHLGLIPSNEESRADRYIDMIGKAISEQVDLQQLQTLASTTPLTPQAHTGTTLTSGRLPLKIGIAQDEAFGFYYPDDLDCFRAEGAELVSIDLLNDPKLPDINGLFIGGGFPESHMPALEANQTMRESVRTSVEAGLPVYAECGGLMYLTRSLNWQGNRHKMAGIIPADCQMHEKPQGRGYVRLQETTDMPWPDVANTDRLAIGAHEFHYSSLQGLGDDGPFAYQVLRGTGLGNQFDGFIYKNLLACYSHQRHTRQNPWVSRFLAFVASCHQQLSNH